MDTTNHEVVIILMSQLTNNVFPHFFFRYNIVSSCWESDAELRPFFSELVSKFTVSLSTVADYFNFGGVSSATTSDELESVFDREASVDRESVTSVKFTTDVSPRDSS